MNTQLLQELGLSQSQAKTYLKLIEKGELTPPEIAKQTGESRSNSYMILHKLEELGLVEKQEKGKKVAYQASNPVALESLAEKHTKKSVVTEQRIKQAMPDMLTYFYSFTEKPGIRLLQGLDGLKEIYKDTLRTRQDIYFMRTPFEVEFMGEDFFTQYKKRRAELGIKTYAFTQTAPVKDRSDEDDMYRMIRSWIKPTDYTAPVEINVYGDKVAYLVYGEEIMGVIIQSAYIADAMRQMFQMIARVKQ